MEITWNSGLVVLSILVAILGSFTALSHIQRMRLNTGRIRLTWMIAGGGSLGLAIWAMHFIGMLAFHLPIPVTYDIRITLLSILPAVAAAIFGFYQLQSGVISLRQMTIACLLMGAGIAAMHYIGMAAMQITPFIVYDQLIVAVSLAIGVLAAGAIPLVIYMGDRHILPLPLLNSMGGVIMGLGLSAMHYTGVAASGFAAGSICYVDANQLDPGMLSLFVAIGVFLLLGMGNFASLFDQGMLKQNQQNMETFQRAYGMAMNMAAELQLVLDSVSQGVVVTDTRLNITYVNGGFEQITGYGEAEALGGNLDMLLGAASNPESVAAMREAIAQALPFKAEILHYGKGGVPFWDEFSINPVRDGQGKLIKYVGVLRDVTERREIVQSISEFKNTLDQTLDCVFMFDVKTLKFFYANRGAVEQVGYSIEEMAEMHPYDIKPDISKEQFNEMVAPLLSGELDVFKFETVHQHKNGALIPVEINLQLISIAGERSRFVAVVRDIAARKLAELELERHRCHLQELVEERTLELSKSEISAREALFALKQQKFVLDQHAIVAITDVKGRIKYANDNFCAISGFSREELLGNDHRMLNSGVHPTEFFREMYRTVAASHVWRGEICNRAKDGSFYWVDTTIAPFMGSDGKPEEYIAIRTDITGLKRAEDAANNANRSKSEFLANMSHEIRTPMNGIVGMLDILQESDLTGEQRRRVETVSKSAVALLSILNDILDFSKIEAGKLSIENIPVSLREVVEGVVQLFPAVVSGRNIDLHVFLSPSVPCWIMSDSVRLRQILFNLVGNALKFSSKDEGRKARVILRVEKIQLHEGSPGLRLSVTDNGIGMSQDTLAQLFQNFTQADESTTRRFGGTGLGLSITRKLVELMGGQIMVSSTLGEGSIFTVELPLQETNPVGAVPAAIDLGGVHALLLSNDPACIETVSAYLNFAGASVAAGSDIKELASQPDGTIVLLDKDIAATGIHEINRSIKLVQFIRGSSGIASSKAVTVMTNPILYDEILHAVAVASGRISARDIPLLRDIRHRQRIKAPTVEAAIAAGQLILLAEDNETNREVITEQLNLLGYASEAAVDGLDALDKWRSGKYSLLLTDCHMPNMDGFQLTTAIRKEQPEGQKFTIIAVTANAMQGEAQRCLACGMDDYLPKPLRLKELGAMLAKWLDSPAVQAGAKPEAVADAAIVSDGAGREILQEEQVDVVWDSTMLGRTVGENPAMHKHLLFRFLEIAEEQVELIIAAIASGDVNAVRDLSHRLKSAAWSVGAVNFGEMCWKLEMAGETGDMHEIHSVSPGIGAALRKVSERISAHYE